MAAERHVGPGGYVSGLLPWIVYWILVGNVSFRLAVLIAFGVAAFQLFQAFTQGALLTSLEVGSTLAFAVLTILTYATDDRFLERWIQPITSGALLAIAVGSIVAGRPFARQYAREHVPEQFWTSPRFLRTTLIITWVWAAVFAVMTVSALIPPIEDGQNTFRDQTDDLSVVFYWVIPILALALGIVFTKWYPERVRARAAAVSPDRA
jgi:tryptophan-rich sensory protein